MTGIRRAGVLGRPIGHSLSPVLHRAAYAALGWPWTYDPIDCGEAELGRVLAERADWAGFSCTMPVKRAALGVATEVRPRARVVGAANTLLPRAGGGWIADNTDVSGIGAALAERGVRPSTVTILGAGGTAQAVVVALAELGRASCTVLVRSPARATDLLETAARAGVRVRVGALEVAAPELAAELVVSTLPRTVADGLAGRAWSAAQAVLDVVYDPWPTALAAAAAARGATVVSGALMLLHQAAAQVELMTGQPAPVAAMRSALRAVAPSAGL
jgi:shikimate dehydrogenase